MADTNKNNYISGKITFTPEEIADGKMVTFINFLTSIQAEIRLWTDGYAYVVEYIEDIDTADGTHFIALSDRLIEMVESVTEEPDGSITFN